ncbi:MAG: UPF0182 family protein, partial [Actinobacteria bacterium]|nr:UPF0182 family protein [Actinomycetota bacterium]
MTFGDNPDNPFRNFRFPSRNLNGGARPKIGALPLTVIILTVLAVILVSLSGFYADFLWFRSVDYSQVWTTLLTTRISLFLIFGLLTSSIVTANIYIAYKRRPIYVPVTVEADNLERYRAQLEPLRKVVLIGVAVALFYFSGMSGTRLWESWLLFRNYTDVNALLPAKSILTGIAALCSLLFFANIIRRSWVLPAAGVALLGISSFLIAGVYPGLIQQFQVKPSESSKEAPYIQRNIEGTRAAYGLDKVEVKDYSAIVDTSAGQLADDAATISNIRLMDPNVLSATFRQLQQLKPYYTFNESLDIDRYTIDGVTRDMVVAVREINIDGNPNRNWINDHLVYTHGFGFVGSYGNIQDIDGKPVFTVGGIPPKGELGEFQPRIYFGENNPEYSIIGGTTDGEAVEFDYPDDASANGQKNYTYTGKGGVPMGSIFSRLLFAIKYQEQRILLSNLINADTKIIFDREPRQRVAKVAPWLKLDGDPYPAIVDNRIQWIIDGYTTSSGYPYSRTVDVSGATTDALNINNNPLTAIPNSTINYIRNSVKATVDAYDGTVTLYAWDEKDPVLATWMKAFPGIVKAKSEMSKDLVSHVRYPEDLFRVQRDVLSLYHVKNANA